MPDNENDLSVEETQPEYVKHYTFNDYMNFDDDERWEIINGKLFLMSAPTVTHQRILGRLYLKFGNFLEGKPCDVFFAPFDVRLKADTTDDTVVQPDLLVICDDSIMMKTGCKGAPDMVVEILSPSTSYKDRALKFKVYQEVGIKEFWIIDPEEKLTVVHILNNGNYYTKIFTETETAPVHILEGFEINLADIFAE